MRLDPNKLSIACRDAGGAELVSSWVRQRLFDPKIISAFVEGPAVDIFARKLPDVRQVGLIEAIRGSDLLVCGTGGTGWEIAAWSKTRAQGIRTAAFVDHWKHYAERFQLNSDLSFPGAVWVTDRCAYEIAKRELPGANIVLKGNPYLIDIAEEIEAIGPHVSGVISNILVVHENAEEILFLGNHWKTGTYNLRSRSHPSVRTSGRSLAEDIAWADIAIGWDSMALVAAHIHGCETFSVLPPEERSIPYPVTYLQDTGWHPARGI